MPNRVHPQPDSTTSATPSATIVPRRSAIRIQGYVYFTACLIFEFGFIFMTIRNFTFWNLFGCLWPLYGCYFGLSIMTLKIEISDSTFLYTNAFIKRKTLQKREIEHVFAYKKPEHILIPQTDSSLTTKVIYVIVPFDRKIRHIEIDTSLFHAEDIQILRSFFGEAVGKPLGLLEASRKFKEISVR